MARGGEPRPSRRAVEAVAGTSWCSANNLSFPVIWAEGVTKTLRGTPSMVPVTPGRVDVLVGHDVETGDPLSCVPNADATGCADGQTLGAGAMRAYLQKDEFNIWQAGSISGAGAPVAVDCPHRRF